MQANIKINKMYKSQLNNTKDIKKIQNLILNEIEFFKSAILQEYSDIIVFLAEFK